MVSDGGAQGWGVALELCCAVVAVGGAVAVFRQPRRGRVARGGGQLQWWKVGSMNQGWPLLCVAALVVFTTGTVVGYGSVAEAYTAAVVVTVVVEWLLWMLVLVALARQLCVDAVPTCSVPCFWVCALVVKAYTLATPGFLPFMFADSDVVLDPTAHGYAATPTRAPAIDSNRLAGMIWAAVAVQSALVLFGCCCCCAGYGVHEDITWRPSDAKPRGDARSAPLLAPGADSAAGTQAGASVNAVTEASTGGSHALQCVPDAQAVDAGLSPQEVESFYDGFGRMQDFESYLYTDKASRALRRLAADHLRAARSVVEIGCGTGAFAEALFRSNLTADCVYYGLDISSTMVNLTRTRLQQWHQRAHAIKVDGSPQFPPQVQRLAGTVDIVVATYVFDAMPDALIDAILAQAAQLLSPTGRLCVCALTFGGTPLAAAITDGWVGVYRVSPKSMGGCRPLQFGHRVHASRHFIVEHSVVMTQMALSSNVVVARPNTANE